MCVGGRGKRYSHHLNKILYAHTGVGGGREGFNANAYGCIQGGRGSENQRNDVYVLYG